MIQGLEARATIVLSSADGEGRSAERRAGYSNDCHAEGHERERGHFWRVADVPNGFGE